MSGWIRIVAAATLVMTTLTTVQGRPTGQAGKRIETAALKQARAELTKQVDALEITPKVAVGKYAETHVRIRADLDALLAKAPPIGPPRWYADGSCEIDVQIELKAIWTVLRAAHQRHNRGSRVRRADLDGQFAAAEGRAVRATGTAAPDRSERRARHGAQVGRTTEQSGIWLRYCTPEGRAQALVAAKADAARKLQRQIAALQVGKGVTLQRAVLDRQPIRAGVLRYVRGLQMKGRPMYHTDELIVDVTLAVRLHEVVAEVIRLCNVQTPPAKGLAVKMSRLLGGPNRILRATGNGSPPEQLITGTPVVQRVARPLRRPEWPKTLTGRGKAQVDPRRRPAGQARLLAQRQAEDAAKADLIKQIRALRVGRSATVKDFADADEGVRADLKTFMTATRTVASGIDERGNTRAKVEIPTDRLWQIIAFWQRRLHLPVR